MKQDEINPNRLQSYLLESVWHSLQNTIKIEENNPLVYTSQPHMPSPTQSLPIVQNPPRPMVAIFSPLALPIVLHDFP